MNVTKTTTSIDNETYRYLYEISLIKLNDKEIFNDIYGILKLILSDMEYIMENNYIDFNDPFLLKFIQNTNNPPIYMCLTEKEINAFEIFESKIKANNQKLNIKRNQMIKTMVILYYKLLIKYC